MRLLRRFGQGELRRNRNEASSDGVFAIVVTLLILELRFRFCTIAEVQTSSVIGSLVFCPNF